MMSPSNYVDQRRENSPRVDISFRLLDNVAATKIPLRVGVMGNLSGHNRREKPLYEREFVSIDRNNFDRVIERFAPKLSLEVSDRLDRSGADAAVVLIHLEFSEFEDFHPSRIVRRVSRLSVLFSQRKRLMRSRRDLSGADLEATDAMIGRIDCCLTEQLDEILHHPEFQSLEATWSGIRLLCETVPRSMEPGEDAINSGRESNDAIVVSLLNATKEELRDDTHYATSHRHSALYELVYTQGYNKFGAQPFSLIVGDYVFDRSAQDLSMLTAISRIVSESFTVFVAGAACALFGIDRFEDLYSQTDSTLSGQGPSVADLLDDNPQWNSLRASAEARFLSLALPRMLCRRPYDFRRGLGKSAIAATWRDDDAKVVLRYREKLRPDGSFHLWGNAAFGFAAVTIECFAKTGWLANIHGVPNEGSGGGFVPRLEEDRDMFDSEAAGIAPKTVTDVSISDGLEKQLAELGFLTLSDQHGEGRGAFCSTPSLFRPADNASVDQQIGSLLQYTLCVGRFAHAIKRLGHHKVGSIYNAAELTAVLKKFFGDYVLQNANASRQKKAEKPLRSYNVSVESIPGQIGQFDCQIMLQLHHDLDAVKVELKTKLVGANAGVGR